MMDELTQGFFVKMSIWPSNNVISEAMCALVIVVLFVQLHKRMSCVPACNVWLCSGLLAWYVAYYWSDTHPAGLSARAKTLQLKPWVRWSIKFLRGNFQPGFLIHFILKWLSNIPCTRIILFGEWTVLFSFTYLQLMERSTSDYFLTPWHIIYGSPPASCLHNVLFVIFPPFVIQILYVFHMCRIIFLSSFHLCL